jgi:hypothetical protein
MYPVITKAYETGSAQDTLETGGANFAVGVGAGAIAVAVLAIGLTALSQQGAGEGAHERTVLGSSTWVSSRHASRHAWAAQHVTILLPTPLLIKRCVCHAVCCAVLCCAPCADTTTAALEQFKSLSEYAAAFSADL